MFIRSTACHVFLIFTQLYNYNYSLFAFLLSHIFTGCVPNHSDDKPDFADSAECRGEAKARSRLRMKSGTRGWLGVDHEVDQGYRLDSDEHQGDDR